MTIRKKLTSVALAGGVLIGLLAVAATSILLEAGRQLHIIQWWSIPAVRLAGDLTNRSEDLSKDMGDLTEVRLTRDLGAVAILNTQISRDFDALAPLFEQLAEMPARYGPAGNRDCAVAAAHMQREAARLRSDWLACRGNPAGDGGVARTFAFADRASVLAHMAVRVQGRVAAAMNWRVSEAYSFVAWATGLTAGTAAVLVAAATAAGIRFGRRLAGRLDHIRAEAQLVGTGDLTASLEVVGTDEIDQIAVAFNGMTRALRGTHEQLAHSSQHDALTGLLNRAAFVRRLTRRTEEAARTGDHGFAVLFLDLDRFKLVNDTLGHAAGDDLLRVVAGRLEQAIAITLPGTAGGTTVARLGGDEFIVLLERVADPAAAVTVAAVIKAALAVPVTVAGRELTVTASVGIAECGGTSRKCGQVPDPRAIMSDADAALYRAKRDGRDGHAVFEPAMHAEAVERLAAENGLRQALDRAEFVLHYQPIFCLADGRLAGFEALVRWRRGEELVRPDLFIPVAEDTGLIVPIGEWVIAEAAVQLARWRADHGGSPPVVTVNVSRRQLADANLVPHLSRVLAEHRLPPGSFAIEVTESVIGDRRGVVGAMSAIRELGVPIYIDDFGTGYSSLSTLHQFPLDCVKVDRAFVVDGPGRLERMAVVDAVIRLAHGRGATVVAEGVETAEQAEALRSLGCDRGQGFLFARPQPATQVELIIEADVAARRSADLACSPLAA